MQDPSEGQSQGIEFYVDSIGDRIEQNCWEYFMIYVKREFPDLIMEPMGAENFGWQIMLPEQRTYSIDLVSAACRTCQEDLFWKKDVLIHYSIVFDGEVLEDE